MESEIISREQIELWYKKALSDLTSNVEILSELAKEKDPAKAEELERLIKRNIKSVTFFRNNN